MSERNNNINSFLEMRRNLLNKNLQIFNHLDDYRISRYLKDKEIDSLSNNVDRIRNILNNRVYFSDKNIKTNSNRDKNNLELINSNMFNDPIKQRSDSATFVDDSKTELNIIYNTLTQSQRDNLHAYMTTLSFRSIDKGLLDLIYRGEKSEKSQRLLNSFKEMVRKLLDKIVDAFHIVGGIVSYEITVNPEKLKNHDGEALYHLHTHLMLITDHEIHIRKIHLHNGKCLNANNYIMSEWDKICKKYDKKNNSRLRKFDPQAFDIREAYSKNSDASFSDTLTEELKYPTKPDYLSTMKDMEDEENVDDDDMFSLEVFAEIMGATYRNPAKLRFGLLNKIHQVTQGSSTLKCLVKAAMNSKSEFNVSGRKQFGGILTKFGKLSYISSRKQRGYWRHAGIRDMSDKDMLFQNSDAITGVLMSSNQLSWLKEAVNTFDVHKMSGTKTYYFDKIISLIDRLPYLQSVTGLTDWIDDVAKSNAVEAIKNQDNQDVYDFHMGKFNDLDRFSKAIKRYTDDKGVVRLGLHTSPDFKYRVSDWVSTYLGSLKDGFSKARAWKFYAAVHDGYKDVADSFSFNEKTEYRRAMVVADGIFHYGEVAPQPREVASFDQVGSFFKVDRSHLGKDKKYDEDTGELLTEKEYDQLTASSDDPTCWSEDGTGFDFNLFANLDSFDDVARELRHSLKPLIKKNKKSNQPKVGFKYQLSTKKMANA